MQLMKISTQMQVVHVFGGLCGLSSKSEKEGCLNSPSLLEGWVEVKKAQGQLTYIPTRMREIW